MVVLHKDKGAGLGFSVAGGSDQHKRVTVSAGVPREQQGEGSLGPAG